MSVPSLLLPNSPSSVLKVDVRKIAATPAATWEDLEPRGFYARFGRPLFNSALTALMLPVAVVLAVPIALINWVQFGDLRRILFVQPRTGHRGRVFSICKFRTMSDARGSAHESWAQGEDSLRVTCFGRFLRNAHLDELPQLLNVLRGTMNVIGPRPEMVEIEAWATEHIEGFSKRLVLKPGMTGRAQIRQGYTGHDIAAYALKLQLNETYLRELSFATDVRIVIETVVWMLRGKGWWRKSRDASSAEPVPDR